MASKHQKHPPPKVAKLDVFYIYPTKKNLKFNFIKIKQLEFILKF
jgi:hypothetical protein